MSGLSEFPWIRHCLHKYWFSICDLVYVARDPVVMGIGFASTRDLVSFLRHERSDANPLMRGGAADPLRWAIGFGRSQSGRYIKDFVYQGFNLDEDKRVVFEGLMPLISGSRRMNVIIPAVSKQFH